MPIARITQLQERYGKHASSVALIAGFVIDNLTLRRIDLLLENLLMLSYLGLAALAIAVINFYEAEVLRGKFFGWLYSWSPIALQFVFGGLFSGFFVFYFRSASIIASWPFLVVLAALLIGNEFFRKRYLRLSFQASVWFVAFFSFSIFSVPTFLHSMGDGIFLLSGVLSLMVAWFFLYLLSLVIPQRIKESSTLLAWSIGGIFVIINMLYFTNIIPPIPLALKEAGVYHHVQRTASGYTLTGQVYPWYSALERYPTVYITPGQPLYVFSSVFAPTKLSTQIFHEWQRYDENARSWVRVSRASFPIVGGRDGGYRGYSLSTRLSPGRWRVDIETSRGQLIGRVRFTVSLGEKSPPLQNETR